MTSTVNIYDFDHTIYDGDASFDFIKFVIFRNLRLYKYLPIMGWALVLYVMGLRNRKEIKQIAFKFLESVPGIEVELRLFWKNHNQKIKTWYIDQKRPSDVIISASPKFLLEPIVSQLKIHTLIATEMNIKTGVITGENCRGQEKVRRLQEFLKSNTVGAVYSDSLSDTPILHLGNDAFIVKKNLHIPFAEYKPSKLSKLKSPEFIRFLFVGGVNALIGVMLSYIFSFFIHSAQLAFVIGFSISLVPSYFLNSTVTFKDFTFTFKKFSLFAISYIPNFLVQLVLVHFITDLFGLYPLFTYVIAVVISVPVTFLLLSLYTFKREANDE